MSIQTPAPAGAGRRRAVLASAFIAALVAPLAVAPPAVASQKAASCTVTAQAPVYSYTENSTKRAVYDYPVRVRCSKGNRTVYVEQQFWEDDGSNWTDPDDYQGAYKQKPYYFKNKGKKTKAHTFHHYRYLIDTESGPEEIYQAARIDVHVSDLNQWSKWDWGPTTSAP
jgi:hypothetical protein